MKRLFFTISRFLFFKTDLKKRSFLNDTAFSRAEVVVLIEVTLSKVLAWKDVEMST